METERGNGIFPPKNNKERKGMKTTLQATNIKKLRICKGLTVQELADKIKVSRQSVYNYENGSQFPNKGVCKRLCKVFKCDIKDLIA